MHHHTQYKILLLIFIGICVSVFGYLQRSEEGVSSLRAGIISRFEPLDEGAGS